MHPTTSIYETTCDRRFFERWVRAHRRLENLITRDDRLLGGLLGDRLRGNGRREFSQKAFGFTPTQTGIGNGDTMKEIHTFLPGLFAGIQVAFEHKAHDGLAAFPKLLQDFTGHQSLAGVILLGIVMRTIDHDRAGDPFSGDCSLSFGDIMCFVVRSSASPAEHEMAIRIAHGLDDGSLAVGIDADEMVRRAGGRHGIDGDLQTAFRPILESDRHGDPAGHFAMGLAFRGAGTDGCPANQVGDVLRADWIQELRSAGKAQLIDPEENRSRQFHPCRDVAGAVETRIVDEPFPPHGGSRLFEVGSHDNEETVTQGIGDGLQLAGILIGSLGVMDGARADDDQEPVAVFSMKNAANGFSGFYNERRRLISNGQLGLDGARRGERLDFNDVLIVDRPIHQESRPLERSQLLWF